MIIPIRCFTCNKVLADKWVHYVKEADAIDAIEKENKMKMNMILYGSDADVDKDKDTGIDKPNEKNLDNGQSKDKKIYQNIDGSYKKDILDKLGLNKLCCRRHMISHVDMMGKI